jgi:MSHA pilin protein MshC
MMQSSARRKAVSASNSRCPHDPARATSADCAGAALGIRGFSLIELIVILVLIGILAVAAIARMDSSTVFAERTEYDMVRAAVQYARKAAIAQRRYVCVQAAAGGLTLTVDPAAPEATAPPFSGACPFAAALPLPQPDTRCPTANVACLAHTSLTSSAPAFQFDAQGRAAAGVTLTVTGYAPINIEAETGLVH